MPAIYVVDFVNALLHALERPKLKHTQVILAVPVPVLYWRESDISALQVHGG